MDFDDFFFITISEDGTNYLGKALGDVRYVTSWTPSSVQNRCSQHVAFIFFVCCYYPFQLEFFHF